MTSHLEEVKAQSGYERWANRLSPKMRFNHLLLPPNAPGDGYRVVTASREADSASPLVDFQVWNVADVKAPDVVLSVYIREFEAVKPAHESLLAYLESITRRGVDYSPAKDGPGDVYIRGAMARDNLVVNAAATSPPKVPLRERVVRSIDDRLMADWPLLAARERGGTNETLDVVIRCDRGQSLTAGKPVEVKIGVSHKGSPLDIHKLPHQVTIDPGRIERKGESYFVTVEHPGKVSLSVSVVDPKGAYGKATAQLDAVADR